MKNIFKEPLLAFLLIGAAMMAVFQQVVDNTAPDDDEIVVTEGHFGAMRLNFEKVWQRPPTVAEMDGLIERYIREEVLYREALAMRLDKDDGIIRRRLSQKMEFLFEDLAGLDAPDEQELLAYLAAHLDDYRKPARLTFQHVFVDASKRGAAAPADALALLARLRSEGTDALPSGDPLMLDRQFDSVTETDIARAFGTPFSQALLALPVGHWEGPLQSGFGLHLVQIEARVESEEAEFESVRDQVLRDWAVIKRQQANVAFYEALRARYRVTVTGLESNRSVDDHATRLSSAGAVQ